MEIWLVLFQNSSNLCNKSLRGKYKQPAECGAHVLADLISFTVQSVLASLSKMFFRDFIFLINCFAKLKKKRKEMYVAYIADGCSAAYRCLARRCQIM